VRINKLSEQITVFQSKSGLLNATVLEYPEYLIVVDTLLIPTEILELNNYLLSVNKPLRYIVNTHFHSDHCYGNPILKQETTRVIAHNTCMNTLISERNMLRKGRTITVEKLKITPPDIAFYDDLEIESGLKLIHTPGHTPDSSVLFIEESRVVIGGDTVLNGPGITVPYFYWGDPYQLLESLSRLQTLSFNLLIPGHGESVHPDELSQDILYLQNLIRKSEVLFEENPRIDQSIFSSSMDISDCLPGTAMEQLWVAQMHILNVQKIYEILRERL
jgi:cyclase